MLVCSIINTANITRMLPEHFASHNKCVSHGHRELWLRSTDSTHSCPVKLLLSGVILGRTPGSTCWVIRPALLKVFPHFWAGPPLMSIHKAPQMKPIHWEPTPCIKVWGYCLLGWPDAMCMCVWFSISDYEIKEVKVRIPRVPTSHGELGLSYKCGDKARQCDSLRGESLGCLLDAAASEVSHFSCACGLPTGVWCLPVPLRIEPHLLLWGSNAGNTGHFKCNINHQMKEGILKQFLLLVVLQNTL